ncbi:uncharacterized protein LOC142166109 [Nicotiana tabacum]|uniref:Uncharacterized protein LOC142166109 n=1 Tax=Nicotiana tabacum TaxID=4097 RepID=A0AC58S6Q0_TOBAC
MKDCWDELNILAPLSSCDCEESLPYAVHLIPQRLMQFLMGLNESYSIRRSNLLARRPIVSVNEPYATVSQEESQRLLGVIDVKKDPLIMLAGRTHQDFKTKKKGAQSGGFRPFANSTVARKNMNSSEAQGYFLTEEQYQQILNMLNKPTSSDNADDIAGAIVHEEDNGRKLWHWRLGHPFIGVIPHIADVKNKVDAELLGCCEICPLAKQSRLKFSNSNSRSSSLFQLMHLDVWGPYRKPTYDKMHYCVTIVDDYSRYAWICLIQSKYEVLTRGDKFTSRARKTVFVGYLETQKAYKLYDLEDHQIFVSRDVQFKESLFPFKTETQEVLGDIFLFKETSNAGIILPHAGGPHEQHPTSAEPIPEPGEAVPAVESSAIDSPDPSDAALDTDDANLPDTTLNSDDVVDQPQTLEAPVAIGFDQFCNSTS